MNRRAIVAALAAVAAAAVSGCGSIELPRESFWRLDLQAEARGEQPGSLALRIADLQLGNALSGDCLLIADGPSQLEPQDFDRWVAPLDRLVTDAVALGLARTRLFALVLGAGDAFADDLTLHGRILDFAAHRAGDALTARVALQFWLVRQGRVLFQDEFVATAPVAHGGTAAIVTGLSAALQRVLDELVVHLRERGALVAGEIDATPGK